MIAMHRLLPSVVLAAILVGASTSVSVAQTTDRLFLRFVVGDDDFRSAYGLWAAAFDRNGQALSDIQNVHPVRSAWENASEHTVWLPLTRSVTSSEIGSLHLWYGTGGRLHGQDFDNAELVRIDVYGREGGPPLFVTPRGWSTEFTGSNRHTEVVIRSRLPDPPNRSATLRLRFQSGDDGMRSGMGLRVWAYGRDGELLTDDEGLTFQDGEPWVGRSLHTLSVPLLRLVGRNEVGRVRIQYTYRGSAFDIDDWDVEHVSVLLGAEMTPLTVARRRGRSIHRFSRGRAVYDIVIPSDGPTPSGFRDLAMEFQTGDDDLGSAVTVEVFDTDGLSLNRPEDARITSARDRSRTPLVVRLSREVTASEIGRVVVRFFQSRGGFSTGDNWNLASLVIRGGSGGSVIWRDSGDPLKRFTRDDPTLDIRLR